MTVYTRACPHRLSPFNRFRDWWRMRHPRGSRRADCAAPLLEVPLPEKTAVPAATPPSARPAASDTAPPAQAERTANPRSVDVEACVAQNPDFAAWLTIPGTPVDYPVVRSNRTDYYLTHLFSGENSKLGCLFSLPSADYQTPSRNIAIYGHHLSHSDAMFSSLVQYKDSGYCAAHSTFSWTRFTANAPIGFSPSSTCRLVTGMQRRLILPADRRFKRM